MTLAHFAPGHEFPDETLKITEEQAAAFAEAVGDRTPSYAPGPGQIVPPMAIVAAGLSRLIERLGLGGGTVHASQEVSFSRPVQPGEELTLSAALKANSLRRGSRFATVEMSFKDSLGEEVTASISTIIAGGRQ